MKNFLVVVEGTSYFNVEADSPDAAKTAALDMFRNETHARGADELHAEVIGAPETVRIGICLEDAPHRAGCICADCSGAELTADND